MRIFEFGFGTGLNALLTLLAGKEKTIIYHTMEQYPLKWSTARKLGYGEFLDLGEEQRVSFKQMHEVKWGVETNIAQNFILKKIKTSILDYTFTDKYDLVFYDAFAPAVQPELWSEEVFLMLYNCMVSNSRLVTYCAKGEVRRYLQRAGFEVERLPGPPGKREMLRATHP